MTASAERRRILRGAIDAAIRLTPRIRPGATTALTTAVWRVIEPAIAQRDAQLDAVHEVAAAMDGVTGARFWAQQLHAALGTRPGAAPPLAWCGASLPGVGAEPIGPCVLRAGHDGPVHQAASGTKWWPTDGGPIPGVRPTADILNGPDLSNGTVPEAFRAAWRRHEMRGDKVPIRLIGGDEPGPYVIDPTTIRTPAPLDGKTILDDVMRLFRGGNHDTKEADQ